MELLSQDWKEEKSKAENTICNIKTLTVLHQLKVIMEERVKEISKDWSTECGYLECKSRAEAIQECVMDIENSIKELTSKKD